MLGPRCHNCRPVLITPAIYWKLRSMRATTLISLNAIFDTTALYFFQLGLSRSLSCNIKRSFPLTRQYLGLLWLSTQKKIMLCGNDFLRRLALNSFHLRVIFPFYTACGFIYTSHIVLERLSTEFSDSMQFWFCLIFLLSLVNGQQPEESAHLRPFIRNSRAIAPSFSSWCIFYPERCRMLQLQDGSFVKRFRFF